MTPRERAISFLEKHCGEIWTEARLIEWFAGEMDADRQSLQSELIKRLQIEKADASPASWLALNGAIGIVQAVFASPYENLPSEEKPEDAIVRFMIPGIEVKPEEEKPKLIGCQSWEYEKPFGRSKAKQCPNPVSYSDNYGQWCNEHRPKITQAESDRRVLAEREACALLADKYADECYEKIDKMKGWKRQADKENEMMNFHDLSKEIRSRSNPQPKEAEPKYTPGAHPVSELPSLTPFNPECSTCVREAKEEAEESAKKKMSIASHLFSKDENIPDYCNTCGTWKGEPWHVDVQLVTIDAPDRIALLTNIIGEQQIKIAELEKELKEHADKIERVKEKIEELNPPDNDDDDRYSYSRIIARS